jgi:F-type H+-transporting ATPase subunit gamma
MKITNAMYLISSSKMKKARKSLQASEPYFNKLQETITNILLHTHNTDVHYFDTKKSIQPADFKRCIIVITSDKGLAGAYNHNVIKMTEELVKERKNNSLIFVGYVGHNYFKKRPELGEIDTEHSFAAVDPAMFRARRIAEYVLDEYNSGNLNEIYVVYTKMRNAMTAEAEYIKLLPMSRDMFPNKDTDSLKKHADYEEIYDPSPEAVLNRIVPNYVKGLIFGAMVEAYASEQHSRMTAMDNATKNAKELSDKLLLLYNRVRQAAITTELTEIISGADALEE